MKVVTKVGKLVGWTDRTMVESWAVLMVYSSVEWKACGLAVKTAALKDAKSAGLRAVRMVVLTVVPLAGQLM